MSDKKWVRTFVWCPYGQNLPNPRRQIVQIGHLNEERRFVAEEAYIEMDTTSPVDTRIDIPLDQLDAEWREALRHPGGGWDQPLARVQQKGLL